MRASTSTRCCQAPLLASWGPAPDRTIRLQNLITLDIGGTSTDVCVVTAGAPQLTRGFSSDSLPIRIPLLDINTIGAGGGSIVWIDDGGMLRVGPQSASADPGPSANGRGGTEPTLTDAHVIVAPCARSLSWRAHADRP
ncbi:MAG: hydantoinase/oxoprolinase family protein [Hyphomicrobiaceae bacterium]